MKCLLIFDHTNDIIFTKYNAAFAGHINDLAKQQGLLDDADQQGIEPKIIDVNVIIQLFSPIVTSQRIMNCQFGNSYTSIQCEHDLNMCFYEYMGYLFVNIEHRNLFALKKFLSICVTIVRNLCGPDVYMLKDNDNLIASTATRLIDSWLDLYETDQAIYVEAVEQMTVSNELSSIAIQALHKSTDLLASHIDCKKLHALLLVHNKFLSLYSSETASELAPSDILFSIILSHSTTLNHHTTTSTNNKYEIFEILLAGSDSSIKCVPHLIYVVPISDGVKLLYLLEIGNAAVSASVYETFCHLHVIQSVQIQKDVDTLRPAFDHLDAAVRRLNDNLKRNRLHSIQSCVSMLMRKWDIIRRKYLVFLKNKNDDEALLRAEMLLLGFLENLLELLRLTSFDRLTVDVINANSLQYVNEAAAIIDDELNNYSDFFRVKAARNFTLGSDSLTINKYLEEFPGLVHFVYIDRTSHRVTAPTLDVTTDETSLVLTKKKIWDMINFAQNHLQEGNNMSLMWKDTTYNYAYFLWFEDVSGMPLKPTVFPIANAAKILPLPGLLGDDFYFKLKEACFPKVSPLTKIKCFELFCVHLGLVTASCVLEHTRRLAATICELRGHSLHPIDLL